MKLTAPFVLTALLAACSSVDDWEEPIIERPTAQSPTEIAFAKTVLDNLQTLSFEKNREYCGYIGLSADGELAASKPRKGRKGSCRPKDPGYNFDIIASYHTHGSYSDGFDSEYPSLDDLRSDIGEQVDGYIATPGGRLWYNNSRAEKTILLCGADCLKSDPDYVDEGLEIAASYTLEQLGAYLSSLDE